MSNVFQPLSYPPCTLFPHLLSKNQTGTTYTEKFILANQLFLKPKDKKNIKLAPIIKTVASSRIDGKLIIFSGERGRGSVQIKSEEKSICSGTEDKGTVVKNYMLELQLAQEYGAERDMEKYFFKVTDVAWLHHLPNLYPIWGKLESKMHTPRYSPGGCSPDSSCIVAPSFHSPGKHTSLLYTSLSPAMIPSYKHWLLSSYDCCFHVPLGMEFANLFLKKVARFQKSYLLGLFFSFLLFIILFLLFSILLFTQSSPSILKAFIQLM